MISPRRPAASNKRIYHALFSGCFRTFAAPPGPRAPQRAGRQAGTGRSIGVASPQVGHGPPGYGIVPASG